MTLTAATPANPLAAEPGRDRRFFVVTGMHRSHTSLLGRVLTHAGLAFHSDLVSATPSNPFGYYEDVDILALHKRILADNGARWYRGIDRPLSVSPARRAETRRLVEERYARLAPLWGFKVPHATLFLDFWAEWDEARFILIARRPEQVLSSLQRRMGMQLLWRPDAPFRFAQAYAVYNEAMADFAKRHRDRCYVISSDDLLTRPRAVLDDLAHRMSLQVSLQESGEALIDRKIVSARPHAFERVASRMLGRGGRVGRAYAAVEALSDTRKLTGDEQRRRHEEQS